MPSVRLLARSALQVIVYNFAWDGMVANLTYRSASSKTYVSVLVVLKY